MKELQHDIELAEQFLTGSLNEVEKQKLASRFDKDKEFNKLIQDMDQLIEGIKYTGSKTTIEEKILRLKEVAKENKNTDKPVESEGKVVSLFGWRLQENKMRYAIAASVVLMAALLFTVVYQFKLGVDTDLYTAYFEPFDSPGSGLTRSGENAQVLKAEAYEAYDAHDYAKAAPLFEKSLAENDEAIVHLCLANSYMALNDFDKAEQTLLHLIKDHTDLVTQTKWYLALIYIKQNKLERARSTLWEISDSSIYG